MREAKQLFICLTAIRISFSMNCMFISFVRFSIGFCLFFLSVSMSSSYMRESSSLWDESQEFFSDLSFVCFFLFVCFLLATLGLHCCAGAFSSWGERGATLHCGAQTSHRGGFSCFGARVLGVWASVVVARGLNSCGLRALEGRLSSCGARA